MKRLELRFESQGEVCEAWLYLPDRGGPHPCIVAAHGIGAVRQVRLGAYAERFAAQGYAMLTFDYRKWGASEGEPRHLCKIRDQHADIHAAIDYARTLDLIDPRRIVLFGTSFGGGHALVVGARRDDLAAVIVQCPIVDGLATALKAPPGLALRWFLAGLVDRAKALVGLPPHYIKLAGEPGQLALMTAPGAEAGYLAMIEGPSPWRNRIGARLILDIPFYRPILHAPRIGARLLVIVTDRDEICPPSAVRKVAALAPRGEAVRFDAGHFDIYFGRFFEQATGAMLAFLAGTPAAAERQPATAAVGDAA